MKRRLHILLLLAGILVLNMRATVAQVWKYVGKGLHSKPTAYCNLGDTLVLALNHFTPAEITDSIFFQMWSGKDWDSVPGIAVNDSPSFSDKNETKPRALSICALRHELYVLIRDYNLPLRETSKPIYRIYKYSGKQWTLIGNVEDAANSNIRLLVFNNSVYCVGNYKHIDGQEIKNIAEWHEYGWQPLPESDNEIGGDIKDAAVFNNALYLLYSHQNGPSNLKYWDGKNFFLMPMPSSIDVDYMLSGDRLYLHGYDHTNNKFTVYVREADGWICILPKGFNGFFVSGNNSHGWVAVNKSIFAVGDFVYGQQSGNVAEWDGSQWKLQMARNFNADSVCLVNDKIYGFSITQDGAYNHIAWKDMKVAITHGYVYKDLNGNCRRDGAEQAVKNMMLEFLPGPFYTTTDSSGYFEMQLPNDSYQINLFVPKYYRPGACVSGDIKLNAISNVDTVFNMPLTPEPNVKDYSVKVVGYTSGTRARQGFTETYNIACTNIGTTASGRGRVALQFPSSLRFVDAEPKVASLSPDELEWDIKDLGPGQVFNIQVKLTTPVNVPLGTRLAFKASTSLDSDADTTNSQDSLIQKVTAAVDPNSKDYYPEGDIKQDVVDQIMYLIRFQNTGTDTAIRVTVIDTIDLNLPFQDITIEDYSHKQMFRDMVMPGGVFKFVWDNIKLPDSATNEPLSHGYIRFTAHMRENIPLYTEIRNTAYITFDYQKPIKTNTALNRIVPNDVSVVPASPGEDQVTTLYPNPASNSVVINFGKTTPSTTLYITNMYGQTVMAVVAQHTDRVSLNVSQWDNGVYFVHDGDGKIFKKLVVDK